MAKDPKTDSAATLSSVAAIPGPRVRRRPRTSPPRAVLALALALLPGASAGHTPAGHTPAGAAGSQPQAAPPDPAAAAAVELPQVDRFAVWLEQVEPLITGAERRLFQSLKRDYQREAFIEAFWRMRDPYPDTPRNELKERWPYRVAQAKSTYRSLTDDRARILMVHGPPDGGFKVMCTKTRVPAEVWTYHGNEQVGLSTFLIFTQLNHQGEARVWNPGSGRYVVEQVLRLARGCVNGSRLQQALSVAAGNLSEYEMAVRRMLRKPRPRSEEWVQTFVAFSTDLPPDAELLGGTVDFAFPGRHQHRTVVQGLLSIPLQDVAVGEFAGYRSHDFQLTGEVLKEGKLFESFRYKFGFPEQLAPGSLPLAFQRFLRPGAYRVVLKLEDLSSGHVLRLVRDLEIPQVDELFEMPTFKDPRTEQLFAEATAAIEAGETGIRLIAPHSQLQTGFVRFDSLVSGSEIEKVRFLLDDKRVATKNRPPYNVEIDLGSFPDVHALRVEGLNADGVEVASDELLINSGGYRFDLKLVEPRRGKRYASSLRARAEIVVPEGRSLERVEFFLNETLVATLFQEPFVQPIVLPPGLDVGYVRAVAYLPDGNATEDLVFINAPDYLEELEIQFVELYTTVLDKQGRPVEGLAEEQFTVFEDDVRQSIARFELVEDLPIHVGILIDNSASMTGTLGEVRKAALSFFQQAITPRDRAAVITFNAFPNLAVELTNNRSALGSGLAGLVAEGQTALYDSVMFSLYYFTGIKGQRAIMVLSDGKDESSRFDFEDTLEYARRAGITIYSIGFRLYDPGARGKLTRLADETGGRAFHIRNIAELEVIYSQIQRELRSQYLIAYQSTNTDEGEGFRAVELKLDRKDVEVKTLSGYYP